MAPRGQVSAKTGGRAKQLPAYARKLIAQRMAHNHPWAVHVTFGEDWTPPSTPANENPKAFIAISPRQYRPGAIDLRCVVGCEVFLDAHGRGWELLAGELSLLATTVWWRADEPVYLGDVSPRARWESVETLALSYRLADGRWPQWWMPNADRRAL